MEDRTWGVKPNVVFFGDAAPRYADMRRAIKELNHQDIAVVIGTSGQVVQIGLELAKKHPLKILNNLEEDRNPATAYGLVGFDKCIYKPATEGVVEIDAIIRETFGPGRTETD